MRVLSRVLPILATAVALAACQYSPDIPTRAVDYNHGVARATNEILLLNIVRAAERTPRYFTRLGTNSAQNGVNSGATATLPFPNVGNGSVVVSGGGSSANTFTLENLDDKKYHDGSMQPIAISTIATLWSQGIQTDLLGMMFMNSISLPKAALPILREVLHRYCGDMRHAQKYCGSADSLIAAEGVAGWRADDCLDPARVPTDRHGGVDYALFVNDPAAENVAGSYHPELCFQIVLRDLLAIGMHLEKRTTKQDVDVTAPAATLAAADFRAELLREGLTVSKEGKVQKEVTDMVLTLDPAATAQFRLHPIFRSAVLRCDVFARRGVKPEEGLHCPPTRAASEADAAWKARLAAYDASWDAMIAEDETKARPVPLHDLKISVDVRSFETVIYYLGEVVRAARAETGAPVPYIVRVLGRQPGDAAQASMYEEALFDLRSGAPGPGAAIVFKDDAGDTNWIPGFCYNPSPPRLHAAEAAATCSNEYPDHDSLTVLALVNQIWGLQKEPSTTTQPILTLGG
ncbi:MAG: hypothetical protein ISS15_13765 [Alphaproteobacteria bacterium]|nr:hypothetical protein [Alphaproteobacteria bacterium]MBL7098721.1 hypothetical protein [Alphaproteobacteria bacterium]